MGGAVDQLIAQRLGCSHTNAQNHFGKKQEIQKRHLKGGGAVIKKKHKDTVMHQGRLVRGEGSSDGCVTAVELTSSIKDTAALPRTMRTRVTRQSWGTHTI